MTGKYTERLDEALMEIGTPDDFNEGWHIRSDDEAAWASRKLRRAKRAISEIEEWAEREMQKIQAVAEGERNRHLRDVEFFEGHLAAYLKGLLREGRKTKTLNLPGGKISLRARPLKFAFDEDAALAWLKAQQQERFVRRTEKLDVNELKKALAFDGGQVILADTGEIIEWATAEEQSDGVNFTPTEE